MKRVHPDGELRFALVALALCLVYACGHPPVAPTPAVEVHTVVTRRGCLHDEKRPQPIADFAAAVPPTCPVPFAACYSPRDSVLLSWYLAALEHWVDNALIDCASKMPATDAGAPEPDATLRSLP